MKRFALLSVLYIYLETGICIEESNISPIDANGDLQSVRAEEWHRSVAKRNSAFKRLPAWSVYYGKRSSESPIGLNDLEGSDVDRTDIENVRDNDIIGDNESDVDKIAFPASLMYYFLDQKLDNENEKILYSDDTKRAIFKRLQPWMSTYGKRSDFIDSGYDATDSDADITEGDLEDLSTIKRTQELSENVYEVQPEFGIDDSKRAPGWHATYGKRSPSWLSTYGKRLAGWTATYGKRAPTWSITYGKRLPGWTATYGKRVPWGATYGKRVPWGATYGKRVPWGATYGKRVPWGATYGKRVPLGATYGKRSQGWNAFYGKRAPMWQAVYGKRDEYNTSKDDEEAEDTSSLEEKRSQAWSAFYGR